jgi:citrate lyase subunit beta/citryl-CoA lyase
MIRSLLFAPANRPDLLAKLPRFGADCHVIDLEDGTPPADKAAARGTLAASVSSLRKGNLTGLLTVRVNEPGSQHYLADLEAALATDIDGVVIAKLEDAAQFIPVVHMIRQRDRLAPRAAPRCIIGGIESMRGVLESVRLCATDPHLTAVYFGAEDFAADLGARRTRRGDEVYFARSQVVLAAKAARITAIDQAVADIRDDELFREDSRRGRDLGYDGKICVLPRQVALANEAFSPAADEVAYAQRMLHAYGRAEAAGKGTIEFEGKIIDGPMLKRAENMIQLAARTAAKRGMSMEHAA